MGSILFLTLNTFSSTGGIEDVCKTFCRVLSDIGKNFMVYSMNDTDSDDAFVKPLDFLGFKGNKIKFGFRAILKGIKSDTIVLSHVNLLLFAKIIKLISPKKRIIMYAHGIEVWREINNWKKDFMINHTEIWAVSNFTAMDLQKRHKIPAENIKVLNNCLNPFFEPPANFDKPAKLLRRYKINPQHPVLFTLTRISSTEKYKGYDIVINILPELIKIYPSLQYIISGKADSKERDRLVRLIKKKGLRDHVFLTGFVDYSELPDHFLLADCFVLPSKKEGFGIVFIESAACGCNVIAGNKDGSTDALLDGELGTLINPDDKEEVLV
ncbi:MAG: glycosyltransferase family 1 protein, partial [Sphingobacteriales bacterium]